MKQRRFLPLALACAVLLSGCQAGQTPQAEDARQTALTSAAPKAISDQTLTLTALQYELDNQAIDFDNLWFYQQLEKRTNVRVDFEKVKQADWETKVNLMFASGDYRDMILRGSLDVEEFGVTQHLLLPLSGLLAENMPVYSSRLALNNAGAGTVSSDGEIYETGFLIAQDVNTNGHFFINQAWLDRLGLETPQTVEELTAVLRAFRDGDPNGNGLADEVPYEATFDDTITGIYNAFSFWGVPFNEYYVYVDDEGVVRHPVYAQHFRDCVAWLNQLYEERLLDMECITQSSNLWSAKINLDTAGFFSYWRLSNTALKESVTGQFECLLPVSAQGVKPCLPAICDIVEFGAALTVHNKHAAQSLKWLDAQMETETMMVSQNGPVGDMLSITPDGRYEINYVPENNGLYDIVPVICGQFFAPADYYKTVYTPAPHRQEKTDYCDYYAQNGVLEKNTYMILTSLAPKTSEQSREIIQLYDTQKKLIKEALVQFITQGVDDAGWNAFIAELDKAGAADYVALYQQVYDAWRKGAGET